MHRYEPAERPEDITEDMIEEIRVVCQENRQRAGSLIPVLQRAQMICGYLPVYVQDLIAEGLNLPRADIYGVVSFYHFFTMVPKGRHTIRVCLGTACYVRGGQRNVDSLIQILRVKPGETTPDRQFSLETVHCLGACGLAPVVVVDEETHPAVASSNIPELLEKYQTIDDPAPEGKNE